MYQILGDGTRERMSEGGLSLESFQIVFRVFVFNSICWFEEWLMYLVQLEKD